MGDVLKVVQGARQMKASLGGGNGSGGDPGIPNLGNPAAALPTSAPVASAPTESQGFGVAMPGPQAPVDPLAPLPDNAPAPQQQPVDNPYVPDTPKELNQGEDIAVDGDTFRPKHESTLGKIADTLLLLRGRAPVFRQRTDNANLREAMKGYDRDPDAAIRRVNMVDADAAVKLREAKERMEANKLLQEERVKAIQEKGFDRLAAMTGAITSAKDPAKAYGDMLPTLRAYAGQYHLDGNDMFPDNYDSEKVGAVRQGGFTPYQQEALQNADETQARLDRNTDTDNAETRRYHDAEIQLRREALTISQEKANKPKAGKPTAQSIFSKDRPNQAVGTLSADGKLAALQGSDGQWYAFRLRKPGDITSRVRSPGDDAMLRKAKGVQ